MATRRKPLRVGDTFSNGNPALGRADYQVVQSLSDGGLVLYRTNIGKRDERNRFYIMGGEGRHGFYKLVEP